MSQGLFPESLAPQAYDPMPAPLIYTFVNISLDLSTQYS